MASHYCEKCNKTLDEKEFYRSNNLEKYPENGLMNQCKKCLTMHVDVWDSATFLWILEDADVPWVPIEWNNLLAKFAQDPTKIKGNTIVGRYLSKMRLKQFKEFRWKDTEFLQELANNKMKEAMTSQGYGAADIAAAIEKSSSQIPEGGVAPPPPPPPPPANPTYTVKSSASNPAAYNFFDQQDDLTEEDLGITLTAEDKLMLRLKWGKAYKPEEWVYLEKLYNEMMDSYDIQTAGHIDTLKLICKTSLKANQLIDVNDVEGYQKVSKVYDQLMKSGKFTAAQTKGANDNAVDSVGEIVAICERDGFIPRYYAYGPQDKVDQTIMDIEKYTHDLVTEELGLGNLIENAVQKIQEEKERNFENSQNTDADFESQLFNYEVPQLTTDDFIKFQELNEQIQAENDKIMKSLEDG